MKLVGSSRIKNAQKALVLSFARALLYQLVILICGKSSDSLAVNNSSPGLFDIS